MQLALESSVHDTVKQLQILLAGGDMFEEMVGHCADSGKEDAEVEEETAILFFTM